MESTFGESSHPRAAIPAHYGPRPLEGAGFVREISDALLMNIFCHPRVQRDGKVAALVGAEPRSHASFGHKRAFLW